MNLPVKVCLCGDEKLGWALDTDYDLTRRSLASLSDTVRITPLDEAEVVHSVWEVTLLQIPEDRLDGKRILCHVSNDFFRISEQACMARGQEVVGEWIAMSRGAQRDLESIGLRTRLVPYSVDTAAFRPSLPEDIRQGELRKRWDIPEDRFVISNFMRDSLADDIHRPKQQKGAELFVAVAGRLLRSGLPIHVLLAGPRRHWVRAQLRRHGVPFTFAGTPTKGDDIHVNILDAATINQLYHISDLHLITSRWEGGPRAVLEAAATRTAVVSPPVGISPDILDPRCLYRDADEAVERIARHLQNGDLTPLLDGHLSKIEEYHTHAANKPRFRQLYQNVGEVPVFTARKKSRRARAPIPKAPSLMDRIVHQLRHRTGLMSKPGRSLTIGLWHEFHKPPYGGGNQFMMALKKALTALGATVVTNRMSPAVDVHICNSAWFDVGQFERKSRRYPVRMIHRIDGPVALYRGTDASEDDRIFSLNARFAAATVYQSAYCYRRSKELGYRAVRPVVISNSVDSSIFHPNGRIPFSTDRKIRIISTSWSDNPRKGGPFYQWLDRRLDGKRFEYTFVGRVQQTFENIRHIPPQNSRKLADLLRNHDIYITASEKEPCSNALLEALACGLPSLFRNDGGNSELASFGGLPFGNGEECLQNLERVVAEYEMFQSSIALQTMEEIAKRYIDLAREILDHGLAPAGQG